MGLVIAMGLGIMFAVANSGVKENIEGGHMRYVLAVALLVSGLFFSDAWASSDKQMALEATISMEQAIKTAVDSVPGGKPYEVEMDKENGRITYKIEIVDAAKKSYKVYVDAQTGKILEKKEKK